MAQVPDQFSPVPGGPSQRFEEALRAAVEREVQPRPQIHFAPPAIPDHVLLRPIGRGAYGEVWLARNTLGTLRAVKVIHRGSFDDHRPFEREFSGIVRYEPISRGHPALMAVLHVGRNDTAGCFYYIMELADDAAGHGRARNPQHYQPRTLRSELTRHGRFGPLEAAQVGVRVAGALSYLHAQGLVHRDIKPGNVIFVEARPKLADIGLVTGAGDSRSFVGTEGFIPPEGPGTPGADLYALGKLLYELITGCDRLDFPRLPPALTNSPDAEGVLELNEILTRACSPDPRQRYSRATEFEADLNLFLAGRSLRQTRKTERHLAWLKWFAVGALLAALLALLALWAARHKAAVATEREALARTHATAEASLRKRAQQAEQETRRQLYLALYAQARANLRSSELGQRFGTLDALRRAGAISNAVELRREALAALALPDIRFEPQMPLDADRTLVLLDPAFERFATSKAGGPVEIRSAEDRHLLALLPASTNLPVYFGRWSPNSRYLALKRDRLSSGARADLEVWEVAAQRRIILERDVANGMAAFNPRLPQVLGTLRDGEVALWSLESGAELARLRLGYIPQLLAFAPDGARFAIAASAEHGSVLAIYDVHGGEPVVSCRFTDRIADLEWHPSGRWLAVADHSGAVHLVESQSGQSRLLGSHKLQAVLTTFNSEGTYLVTGGWERELICWDVANLRRAFTMNLSSFLFQFQAAGPGCAAISPSGLHFGVFAAPAAVRDFGQILGGRIAHAAFSPDSRWLVAAGQEQLGVWDLQNPSPVALSSNGVGARVAFASGSQAFLTSSDTESLLWSITPRTNADDPPRLTSRTIPVPAGFVSCCAVSNRIALTSKFGSRLLSADAEPVTDGPWMPTIEGVGAASADGQWLAVFRPYSPLLHVYRLPALQETAVLTNQANIREAQFAPGDHELVTCASSGLEFWSTKDWHRTRRIPGFAGILFTTNPGECWLTKDYRSAGLYQLSSLEPLLPLPLGTLPLALSPDGRFLAANLDGRHLQLWDLVMVRRELRALGLDWQQP